MVKTTKGELEMFEGTIWLWIGFNLFVLSMLALDLGLYLFWDKVSPASDYSNSEAALAFFTGYLIEKSLSVDNIFVFVLLFTYFAVPAAYQHRVLFWGILGALLMRGIMIVLGAVLLDKFHWIIYLFGAFLIVTGVRMAFHQEAEVHPERNPLLKLVRLIFP